MMMMRTKQMKMETDDDKNRMDYDDKNYKDQKKTRKEINKIRMRSKNP